MKNGWIKLYRKTCDNPIVMASATSAFLWVWLLLNACNEPTEYNWEGELITLQKGQLITSTQRISEALKQAPSRSTIWRNIKRYTNATLIETQTKAKSTLITIVNYADYQASETQLETQVKHKWNTSETKTKNIRSKEKRKEEKERVYFVYSKERSNTPFTLSLINDEESPLELEYINQLKGVYQAIDVEEELQRMKAWLISNPKNRKTSKGIKRFINSWLSRAQDKAPKVVEESVKPIIKQPEQDGSIEEELAKIKALRKRTNEKGG